MSSGLAETGGFDTKTQTEGEQKPDLRLVPEFDAFRFSRKISEYLDIDDPADERVVFINHVIETIPDYTPDLLEQMARSEDPEVLEVANFIIPEIISRAVSTEALGHEDLDRMRDAWGTLLVNEEIRTQSVADFKKHEARLMEEDVTTYRRIGWLTLKPQVNSGFAKDLVIAKANYEKSKAEREKYLARY